MASASCADLVLVNGNVVPMCTSKHEQALAVKGGRIAAVGSTRAVADLTGAHTEVIDLRGRTVLPGFIDSHVHAFLTGMSYDSAQLAECESVADVCRHVGAKAAETPPGSWVYAFGCRSPALLRERRFPSLAELDVVTDGHPAYVCADSFHSGATNTEGLARLDVDWAMSGVEKDPATGQPTGSFLDDDAHFAAARQAFAGLGREGVEALYHEVGRRAAARGVTTLHCLDGQFVEGDIDAEVLNGLRDCLPVHTVLMYQTMDVGRVMAMGLPRIGGCLTIDGAGYEHTSLFYEPYADEPSTCGNLFIPEDKVASFVLEAHCAGLQIGMHAIGDRAIDILVAAYDEAMRAHPREDCRHRVEHFCFPTEWAIERAHSLGLALPMQPVFSHGGDVPGSSLYARALGESRAQAAEPYHRLTAMDVVVSGGSDSPVTEIHPLRGVHAAVNSSNPIRRVAVENALRMFTINGAWVGREEASKGSLEVGKLADLVVLDDDPYRNAACIEDLSVDLTIVAGRIAFARSGVA